MGERVEIDEESGNRTIVPILQNVTTVSLEGCMLNRSTACLATCSDVGYLVCVPEIDPFDLCVQSCVANLTYIEPAYELDQSLAVCKKKLRLTPSMTARRGAAWKREKQPVREGFRTAFAFKMDQISRRCPTTSHPSHEERPDHHDMLCQSRGGDGFAFVVQDAGQTSYDAECAFEQVSGCVDGEAEVCLNGCKSLCPSRVDRLQSACLASCLRGVPHLFPRMAALGEAVPLRVTLTATAEAAAAACEPFVGACVAACDGSPTDLATGAAMHPGTGCLHTCLSQGAQAYCEARCPLVDEDLDLECISACALSRMERAMACFGGCSASCGTQGETERVACQDECLLPEALMPSGETVDRCRRSALAHPPHDTAVCLASCAHTNGTCLVECAQRPADALPNCVEACPQGNTLCVAECLSARERLGAECILPRVTQSCGFSSVAIGDGDAGLGYGNMRNAVAIKFDTWYNWDKYDPGFFHVAVHAGSVTNGATTVAPEALGLAYDFADLNDGEYHEALIEYSPHFDDADAGNVSDIHTLSMMPAVAARLPTAQRGGLRYLGMLTVHLDGKRILRVPINLEEVITLDSGKAYVGFTGATGSAYQEHSIVNWRFNSSKAGTLDQPANLHCRHPIPSLWHAPGHPDRAEWDGSPIFPQKLALGCTTGVMDFATPLGAMHSLQCDEPDAESGTIYCHDPNMRNVPPMINADYAPLLDVAGRVGVPFVHTLPRDCFLDRQADGRMSADLLTYSLSYDRSDAELKWLAYDNRTRTLRGTPTAPGTWPITVVATDPGFRDGLDPPLSTTDVFLLQVVGIPVVSSPAGDREVLAYTVGESGEAAPARLEAERGGDSSASTRAGAPDAAVGCRCFANGASNEAFCQSDTNPIKDPNVCDSNPRCHWGPDEDSRCRAMVGTASTRSPPPPPLSP